MSVIVPLPAVEVFHVSESASLRNWAPLLLPSVESVTSVVAESFSAAFPVAPPMAPFSALSVTVPPVTSVVPPPSVMSPVRAVSVTALVPAASPSTAIEPPTMVTLSVNVELFTSTAPVPLLASPIVIELKPSASFVMSVSPMSKSPVPPPTPSVDVTSVGLSVSAPLLETVSLSTASPAVTVMSPLVEVTSSSVAVPSASSVIAPVAELTAVPADIAITPSAVPAPAFRPTAPEPTAETVPAVCRMSLAALSVTVPLPPLAVTFALTVRSSVALVPAAVSVTLPPPELTTASFTITGLLADTTMSPPVAETPTVPPMPPIVSAPAFETCTPPLLPSTSRLVTVVSSGLPDVPAPVCESATRLLAVTSFVVPASPSVMAPVRAVSVTAFEPATSSVTAIEPPTIVIGSVNVELLTSTAPEPFVASPIVIELKPSVNRPISASFRLKSPVGLPAPTPIVRLTVVGFSVSAPPVEPMLPAARFSVSAAMEIAPLPEVMSSPVSLVESAAAAALSVMVTLPVPLAAMASSTSRLPAVSTS